VRTELDAKASTIADGFDGQVTSLRTGPAAASHNARRADRDKDPPPPDFSDQDSVRAHAEAMVERRFEVMDQDFAGMKRQNTITETERARRVQQLVSSDVPASMSVPG
jgi:hypothetical protein